MGAAKALAATNTPGTCLWCGAKLHLEHDVTRSTDRAEALRVLGGEKCRTTTDFGSHIEHCTGTINSSGRCNVCLCEQSLRKRIVDKKPRYDKPGYKGNGYFCRLTCAAYFGIAYAGFGYRLTKKKKQETAK